MARFFKKKDASLGQSPGALIFIGSQKIDEPEIHVIDYDSTTLQEIDLKSIREGAPYQEKESVTWINVFGLHDTALIKEIGDCYGLHSLTLEDIVHTGQRPKMEDYDDYLFFVMKMLRYDTKEEIVVGEQLSIVLGKKFVITFQENKGDVFEPVLERIRKQKGRIRGAGIDYLAYALLDTVIDNYITIIELLGEDIEDLEGDILNNPSQEILEQIHYYKREMNYIRKSVRPAREFIMRLNGHESDLIREMTRPFLKDLHDLATQASEIVDTYREMLSDHLNIYHSGISNRLNEVMKVLTIFSAIFIPLTFIAGIYGTNFDYLPELHYKYSYFIFWLVLLAVAGVMLKFFKRRGWM